jgi:phosphoribosyl 1,2-cyclic phosphodiesterase
MRFAVCVLASGSKGNCVVVMRDADTVLVDCGISAKRVLSGLYAIGIDPESVRGIVLTHEHRDHCAGVGPLSRKLGVPVFATRGTHDASTRIVGEPAGRVVVDERKPFVIGSLRCEPFPTFHDAADPFALVLRPATGDGPSLAVVTDLGFVSTLAYERLKGVRTAMFESNHDRDMLVNGPYPWELKQRILGRAGHLDNISSALALARLWESGLRQVLLAHLSEVNNSPGAVIETMARELPEPVRNSSRLFLTHQDRSSEIVDV